MRIPKQIAIVSWLAFLATTGLGASERNVNFSVRVFQVPQVQNWDAATAETSPGISSLTVRGDSTAAFPDAILYIATELAPRADDGAIIAEIMRRVFFGNGDFRAKRVSIEEIGGLEALLTSAQPSAVTKIEKERTESSSKNYGLEAELRPSASPDIPVRLRFDAGSSYWGGRLSGGFSSTIFSETLVVPEDRQGKLLLIGFPSHDKGPRGTIYWLAVSASRVDADPVVPGRR